MHIDLVAVLSHWGHSLLLMTELNKTQWQWEQRFTQNRKQYDQMTKIHVQKKQISEMINGDLS